MAADLLHGLTQTAQAHSGIDAAINGNDHLRDGAEHVDRDQRHTRGRVYDHQVVDILDGLQGRSQPLLAADLVAEPNGTIGQGGIRRKDVDPGDSARPDSLDGIGIVQQDLSEGRLAGALPSSNVIVALAWLSPSTNKIRLRLGRRWVIPTARARAVVVFPTPPLWFTTAIERMLRSPVSHVLSSWIRRKARGT